MSSRWNRSLHCLLIGSTLTGCVTVHAPLEVDLNYPLEWGRPTFLGSECKSLEGRYRNAGEVTVQKGKTVPLTLTSALHLQRSARTVSLRLETRKQDRHGDAFVTLHVITDDGAQAAQDMPGCYCIRETLACTQVREEYWSFPNFGLGGSQRNLYLSRADDGALIAKLQDYHVDIVLGIPLFGIKEPWARFTEAPVSAEDY